MKIYGISGLGADQRVFQYLKLNCEFIPIDWIEPLKNEPLEQYARRLAEVIDNSEGFGILGVSFGGLVAIEISKQLSPEITILISSAETNKDLRHVYKVFGRIGLLKMLPYSLFNLPRFMAYWLFGTEKKKLLNEILNDTDLKFTKWAINKLINWENVELLQNSCFKISGTHDKLIPPGKSKDTVLIEKGEHFMIVDRAEEISEIINKKLKNEER